MEPNQSNQKFQHLLEFLASLDDQELTKLLRFQKQIQLICKDNLDNLSASIEKLNNWQLAEVSEALGDAHSAITEALYIGSKNDLWLEGLTKAKRTISEMKQICEDIEATEIDLTSIESKIMNDLPSYLRSVDSQSCKTLHQNFQNALALLCREIHRAEGRGFEWVGQMTVAANIIQDALDMAEAFTDGE